MLDLPRRAPSFVGRTEELARLRGGLGRDAVVAVEGRAGSGKTALALELGHELLEKGETVLWMQARPGWSTESVLMTLTEQWQLSFDPQLSVGQHVVQLASALARERAYLFVDDFHHLSDKHVFFEGMKTYLHHVSLFLTSRTLVEDETLKRVDCTIVQLESLAPDDVRALLVGLLRQHGLETWLRPESLEELSRRCLGSPMLSKLLVSLLIQGHLNSLTDLQSAREEIYGLLIGELEHGLSGPELELLKRLSVYRVPVPRRALPEGEETDGVLESLRRKLLVETLPGRLYTVHDVFRDYYESRMERTEREVLHARCASYYMSFEGSSQEAKESIYHCRAARRLERAAEVLAEYGKRFFQAAQYDYLLEHIEVLCDQAGPNRLALMTLKAEVLALIGGTRESLALFTQVEEESADIHLQIRALNSRCHLVLEQGQLDEAMKLADRALGKLDSLSGRRPGRVKALNGRALALARQGAAGALEASERSLSICKEIGDPRGECYAHYAQALVYRHADDWSSSLEAARRAISDARRARETRLAFLARFLEGTALLQLGRDQEAEQTLECSYEDSEDYPDPLSRSMARLGLALQRARSGCWDEAHSLSLQAVEFGARHGGRVFAAQLYLSAGQLAEGFGREGEAREQYRRGLEVANQAGAWPLAADLELREQLLRPEPDPNVPLAVGEKARKKSLSGVAFRASLATGFLQAVTGKTVEVKVPEGWRPGFDDAAFAHFLEHSGELPAGLWRPLAKRLQTSACYPFRVTTREGAHRATAEEVQALRDGRSGYDLWLDLPQKTVVERSKGPLKLLRRKVLTRLLLCLLKSAGTPHSQEEVFLEVWGPPYQDETSGAQVRKNVSALRDMLEPDRAEPRYVKVREATFGVKGGYFFCPDMEFCLIESS